MKEDDHNSQVKSIALLAGLLLMITLFSGCVERGAIVVNCGSDGEQTDEPRGCVPLSSYSGSATGFRSKDGASPVPASANKSCTAAGSWKCANEGKNGCSLLNPNKVCKSYYYYKWDSR